METEVPDVEAAFIAFETVRTGIGVDNMVNPGTLQRSGSGRFTIPSPAVEGVSYRADALAYFGDRCFGATASSHEDNAMTLKLFYDVVHYSVVRLLSLRTLHLHGQPQEDSQFNLGPPPEAAAADGSDN